MRLTELRGVFFMYCGRKMESQSGHSRLNVDYLTYAAHRKEDTDNADLYGTDTEGI